MNVEQNGWMSSQPNGASVVVGLVVVVGLLGWSCENGHREVLEDRDRTIERLTERVNDVRSNEYRVGEWFEVLDCVVEMDDGATEVAVEFCMSEVDSRNGYLLRD